MSSNDPLIAMDSTGKASVISYNVPEPTSYYAKNLIRLDYSSDYFQDHCFTLTETTETTDSEESSSDSNSDSRWSDLVTGIVDYFDTGILDSDILDRLKGLENLDSNVLDELRGIEYRIEDTMRPLEDVDTSGPRLPDVERVTDLSDSLVSDRLTSVADKFTTQTYVVNGLEYLSQNIATNLLANKQVIFRKTMSGDVDMVSLDIPTEADPRLYLVETYRISTYLGNYGAGRIVKTFSLLPGEATQISITTYKKSTTTATESSSILDSYTEEAASEFEENVLNENTTEDERNTSFDYFAETSASGGGNIGMAEVSAEVSAGVSGSIDTARKEQTKNVSNTVNKHAAKASTTRDVEINTSYESTTEEGEETSIVRDISNINLSRTLNFVFRQMNQEFYTFTHMVDIRIGYFNGDKSTKMEVPVHKLDSLLEAVVHEDKREDVKDDIHYALANIYDYAGDQVSDFLQTKTYTERDGSTSSFMAIDVDKTSDYSNDATGASFTVPGIILGVTTNVMRTEGVMVEALLGEGEALDDYNQGLQEEKVNAEKLANAAARLDNRMVESQLKIIRDKDGDAADVYDQLFDDNENDTSGTE